MGGGDRCGVAGCKNDRRQLRKVMKRSHVQTLKWFGVANNEAKRRQWQKQLQKGRQTKDAETKWTMGSNVVVCSNHFVDGKPT